MAQLVEILKSNVKNLSEYFKTNCSSKYGPIMIGKEYKQYKTEITKYLKLTANKEPPVIIDGKQCNTKEVFEPVIVVTDMDGDNDFVIQNNNHQKQHYPSRIENKYALKTLQEIPAGTILGEFIGPTILKQEYFALKFSGFTGDLGYPICIIRVEVKEISKAKINEILDMNVVDKNAADNDVEMKCADEELSKTVDHVFELIINPSMEKDEEKCIFKYLHDCREDLNKAYPTKAELERVNVDFVHFFDKGWPRALLISSRVIKQNEYLFMNYGRNVVMDAAAQRLIHWRTQQYQSNVQKMEVVDDQMKK